MAKNPLDFLNDIFQNIGQVFQNFFSGMAESYQKMADDLSKQAKEEKKQQEKDNKERKQEQAAERASLKTNKFAEALENATRAVNALVLQMGGTVNALPVPGKQPPKLPPPLPVPKSNAAKQAASAGGLASAASAISGAIGIVAQIPGMILSFIDTTKSFVQALNPSLINAFDTALNNLSATLGVAFEPMFVILTQVVNQISGLLLPVMQNLRGTFSLLGEATMSIVKAYSNYASAFYEFARPLIYVFEILLALFQQFWEIINVIVIAAGAFFKTIRDMTGGVGDIVGMIKEATQTFVTYLIIIIGRLAKFLGMTTFLNNFVQRLEDQSKPGAIAAMKNASTSGFEQIAKDLAIASATAAGVGMGEGKGISLEEGIMALKDIQSEEKSIIEQIFDDLHELVAYFRQNSQAVETYQGGAASVLAGGFHPLAFLKAGYDIANGGQ